MGVFVGDNVNFERGLAGDNVGVSEGFVSDLVKCIRCIGNEFSQEDLFVGVESIDDQSHKLLNISVEGKVLLSLLCLAHL